MDEARVERRRSQRVDANLNLTVTVPRGDGTSQTARLETLNISSSGVYFRSDHFIEPMTKLSMELEVAIPDEQGRASQERAPVRSEGLVVRVTPEAEVEGCDSYEVAVFFTHIDAEGMQNLERHISLLIDCLDD